VATYVITLLFMSFLSLRPSSSYCLVVAESDFGYDTCVMEGGSLIRTGNHVLETKSQTQAMYGRIKPVALEVRPIGIIIYFMYQFVL
jgi:hypothetical protein